MEFRDARPPLLPNSPNCPALAIPGSRSTASPCHDSRTPLGRRREEKSALSTPLTPHIPVISTNNKHQQNRAPRLSQSPLGRTALDGMTCRKPTDVAQKREREKKKRPPNPMSRRTTSMPCGWGRRPANAVSHRSATQFPLVCLSPRHLPQAPPSPPPAAGRSISPTTPGGCTALLGPRYDSVPCSVGSVGEAWHFVT